MCVKWNSKLNLRDKTTFTAAGKRPPIDLVATVWNIHSFCCCPLSPPHKSNCWQHKAEPSKKMLCGTDLPERKVVRAWNLLFSCISQRWIAKEIWKILPSKLSNLHTLQLCITRKFLSYGLPPLEVGFLYLFCMPIVQAAKASFMIISCIVLHRKVPDFGFCCGSKLLLLALLVGDRIFHNVMTALGPSVNKIYILRLYTRVHTK